MPENEEEFNDYSFESDEVKVSPFNFGLNAGKTFLTKFEYTPTGGTDGAEQDALDIIFNINGTDKSYRMFPVTKAFLKAGGETTDRNAPEFKDAVKDFNAKVFHIVHCFVETDTYKAATSRKISSFKEFCTIVASLLPKDFSKKPLDCFMQFQWQPSPNKNKTYLELPKKMSYGKWVIPAQPGTWEKIVVEDPSDDVREALKYGKKETAVLDEKGKVKEYTEFHPFTRNGWFMKSNFAHQQNEGTSDAEESGTDVTTPSAAPQSTTSPTVESW